jgi:branched-chain amino acid transport system permease protein
MRGRRIAARLILLLFLLVVLVTIPHYLPSYVVAFLFLLFMYTSLAQGWDILGGYTGYLNLGYSMFLGISAYLFAYGIVYGFHPGLSLIMGTAAATIFAIALSFPLFRVRGAYFALTSFGIIILLRIVISNLEILGGNIGEPLPPSPLLYAYYGALAIAVAASLTKYYLAKSKLGMALASIREDEEAAAGLGVRIFRCKLVAFTISAVFSGLMGGVYLMYTNYIDPHLVFGLDVTLLPVVMAMLGGSGTVLGPLIGVVVIMVLEEFIWTMTPYLHLAMYGAIFVLVGIFLPNGIMGLRHSKLLAKFKSGKRS